MLCVIQSSKRVFLFTNCYTNTTQSPTVEKKRKEKRKSQQTMQKKPRYAHVLDEITHNFDIFRAHHTHVVLPFPSFFVAATNLTLLPNHTTILTRKKQLFVENFIHKHTNTSVPFIHLKKGIYSESLFSILETVLLLDLLRALYRLNRNANIAKSTYIGIRETVGGTEAG